MGILNLSATYLKNYLSLGLETWSADRGWCVDYLLNVWAKSNNFCGIKTLQILPYLGTSKCWGHSVLQTPALVYFFHFVLCFMVLLVRIFFQFFLNKTILEKYYDHYNVKMKNNLDTPKICFNYRSPVKRICVFEHSVLTNFNCACPVIQRGQGSGFLSEGSSWLTACMSEQRRFWRDCADAQARLNLRCSHRR